MNCRTRFRATTIAFALATTAAAIPFTAAKAQIAVGLSINVAPPPLPVYVQPPLPQAGYLWTPGYWGYGEAGYYWTPGVWARPPAAGLLWTPGYWGFAGGSYGFHAGYWGPHVGFYGGVNYGFGFGGIGFAGGEWRGGAFAYNSAVSNFGSVHVANVYNNTTIVQQNTIINTTHTSFNGPGGIAQQPTAQEQQFTGEQHTPPTANQVAHQTAASQDRAQLASLNHGTPGTAAASSPSAYHQTATQHAQTQPITAADRSMSGPNGREANQDQRISNGLKTGQMTSGEAARADRTQAGIDSQVHSDRAANGGTLTSQEKQQVTGEQNAASRQVYNEKHNANTITPNAVDNREANQQQRVANGLRSGQETSGEAARANARQSGVDQEVHNDRVANGGALTAQQHAKVARQQNRSSQQVYNQKHNAATHAPPPEHEAKR